VIVRSRAANRGPLSTQRCRFPRTSEDQPVPQLGLQIERAGRSGVSGEPAVSMRARRALGRARSCSPRRPASSAQVAPNRTVWRINSVRTWHPVAVLSNGAAQDRHGREACPWIGRLCFRMRHADVLRQGSCGPPRPALWLVPRAEDRHPAITCFTAEVYEPLRWACPVMSETPSDRHFGREPGTQGRHGPDVTVPSIASLGESGSSSADAAEQEKATKKRQTAAGAGAAQPQLVRTETRDNRPASRQQEMSRSLTDSPPRMVSIRRAPRRLERQAAAA
jgi:hypothetical protein